MKTFETEDLSGDFNNGAWKNAGIDSKTNTCVNMEATVS